MTIKYLIIASINLFFWQACFNQKHQMPCKGLFEVDIENSGLFDEESLIKDSMLMKLEIVFEQSFNDSIHVFCNEELLQTKMVKTNNMLGVSPDFITIDYSKYNNLPKVSIVIGNKNRCINFYPIRGKRRAYINYVSGGWSVELSNFYRRYQ